MFGLVKADGRKQKEQFSLNPIDVSRVQYGKAESKKAINSILSKVLFDYKYSSLPELNAVLNLYNVHADRGSEESRVFKNNGLLYKILDENSKPIGVPIKASEFYSRPTLKFLEEKFRVNETKKEYCKSHVKNALRHAFSDERMTSVERLSERLKDEAIHTILRKSSEGKLYGITFIDFKTQSVVNGSSQGKEFSAKGIQETCAMNILALERKYQSSLSTASENFQNIELKEYVKKNLADILLRGEKVNKYVSKKLKKKKKKRLFKGI